MADENLEPSPEWDLSPLIPFLTARSKNAAEAAWGPALETLKLRFSPEVWGYDWSINEFGPGAHSNLYNTESQSNFRAWLNEADVSVEAYGEAVGPVQYVSFQIHNKNLFDRPLNNRGWRVRVIGFPSIGILALGLSSHYQGTQNHNRMGEASALIRARAIELLSADDSQLVEAEWPSATSEHWEERGLMSDSIHLIGDLDIGSFDEGRGVKLRMVRNTTVKKELSTFFAIRGSSLQTFLTEGPGRLEQLKRIALSLGQAESK